RQRLRLAVPSGGSAEVLEDPFAQLLYAEKAKLANGEDGIQLVAQRFVPGRDACRPEFFEGLGRGGFAVAGCGTVRLPSAIGDTRVIAGDAVTRPCRCSCSAR